MIRKENNHAFIDGANLHHGMNSLGWKLDYPRFRIFLSEKYSVTTAYIFLGLIPKYKDLYESLQKAGFVLVFKEVIYGEDGKAKGNCDAELVVKAVQEAYENTFNKAVLISSDGDYFPLVKLLIDKGKMECILSPYETAKCSILLKRTGVKISYISDQKNLLKKGV